MALVLSPPVDLSPETIEAIKWFIGLVFTVASSLSITLLARRREERKAEAEAEMDRAAAEKARAEAKKIAAEADAIDLEGLADMNKNSLAWVQALMTRITKIETDLDESQRTVVKAQTDFMAASGELRSVKRQLDLTMTAYQRLEGENNELRKENIQLKERIAHLCTKIDKYEADLAELTSKVHQLETRKE